MILIDNLNLIRNSFYSLKIYTNFKDFKYIFFCYPTKNKSKNLNLKILTKQVNYYYLKKLKTIRTISFMFPYLNNSIELYCTNDEKILKSLIQDINSNILFCKIDKNYYSITNLLDFVNSKMDLVTFLNNYFYNFVYLFNNLKKN